MLKLRQLEVRVSIDGSNVSHSSHCSIRFRSAFFLRRSACISENAVEFPGVLFTRHYGSMSISTYNRVGRACLRSSFAPLTLNGAFLGPIPKGEKKLERESFLLVFFHECIFVIVG